MMVFQLQIAKDQNVLPLKRDYMFEAEERLRQAKTAGLRDFKIHTAASPGEAAE